MTDRQMNMISLTHMRACAHTHTHRALCTKKTHKLNITRQTSVSKIEAESAEYKIYCMVGISLNVHELNTIENQPPHDSQTRPCHTSFPRQILLHGVSFHGMGMKTKFTNLNAY